MTFKQKFKNNLVKAITCFSHQFVLFKLKKAKIVILGLLSKTAVNLFYENLFKNFS